MLGLGIGTRGKRRQQVTKCETQNEFNIFTPVCIGI